MLNGTNLPNGIITTVAGNGNEFAALGDGGAATNAGISPTDVAVDGAGNLFIADLQFHRVRKVGANGMITTFAGGSTNQAKLGDGGPATNAILRYPSGVALDAAGNMFISDLSENRVRRVDTNGIITTVAGTGGAGYAGDGGPATNAMLNEPDDVAVDSAGNVFIADSANYRVRKVCDQRRHNHRCRRRH